jgi:transcriptional regulator with XRE-family HTH domain
MRLKIEQTSSKPNQNNKAEALGPNEKASFEALWAYDEGLVGLAYDEPIHIGHFVRHERLRQNLSVERLADKMSIGRRRTRIKWIEQTEARGEQQCDRTQAVLHGLGFDEQDVLRRRAYVGIYKSIKLKLARESRIVEDDGKYFRLTYPDKSSLVLAYYERKALAENLSFLMENRDAVIGDLCNRSCLITNAYLSRGKTPDDSPVPKVETEPRYAPFVALPLGALLELWSRDQLIVHDNKWGEPLHVVRAIGHDAVESYWVEGVLRRSRKWVQCCVPRDERSIQWHLATASANKMCEDQNGLLWRNFRFYTAYHQYLDHAQQVIAKNVSDAQWTREQHLPPWIVVCDAESVRRMRESWRSMVKRLEDVCGSPLSDPMWQSGVPEFSWINVGDTGRWGRWRTGISTSMFDCMGRVWTKDSYEKTLAQCIEGTINVPVLTELISKLKGDPRVHLKYCDHLKRLENDRMALATFEVEV